jgi:hypothetical protein
MMTMLAAVLHFIVIVTAFGVVSVLWSEWCLTKTRQRTIETT